jgi:hypothetical protein
MNLTSAEYAKRIFVHYFKLALTRSGGVWDSDCQAEIEGAVDALINAATAASLAEVAEAMKVMR